MTHSCARCKREFTTAAGLARHASAKKQCTLAAARDEAAGEAPAAALPPTAAAGDQLARNVWEARDLMRRAGITGMESLDCIVALFALREVERLFPRLSDGATWRLPKYPPPGVTYAVKYGLVLFSRIAASLYDDGENRDHWHVRVRDALEALKFHPDTAEACAPLYCDPAKMFPLSDSAATHALVRLIRDKIAFDGAGDTAGRTFMAVVRDFLDGKELGQFFTPPAVVECLAARAAEGRALGRVLDPTCGSGGFLAAAARGGAAEVHGCEIDIRVQLLGYFNALVSGAAAPRVHRADFTRGAVPGAPFDTVLANPPFGVKGVDYAELVAEAGPNGAEGAGAFPLKSSATGLFLQRVVRCLAVGGRGCVVLPLGKELAGRSAAETLLRRALLTAVDLREIIAFPAGAFENTGIRTVAIVFDKRRELGDCLDRKRRGVGFVSGLRADIAPATGVVRLTRLRADGGAMTTEPVPGTHLAVTLEMLEAAGWSLSPDDYKVAAAPGTQIDGDPAAQADRYPMVRLGELFTLKKGRVQASKVSPGPYPVISIGLGKTHDEATDDGEVLVINTVYSGGFGSGGLRVHYHNGPCAITNIVGRLSPVEGAAVDLKYAKYLLDSMIPTINTSCEKGLANKTLDQTKFFALVILLPPIEAQRAIAAELDTQAADIAALEKAVSAIERARRNVIENAVFRGGVSRADDTLANDVRYVRLGDVCKLVAGKSITKTQLCGGAYPVVGGGVKPMGFHCEFNTDANTIIVSATGASCGWVGMYDVQTFRSADNVAVLPTDDIVKQFLHHILIWLTPVLQSLRTGLAQPHLDKAKMLALEIPLPPIEVQRAVAAELDALGATGKGLTAAIVRARRAMRTTLARALGIAEPSDPFEPSDATAQPAGLEDALADAAAEA